MTVSTTVSAPGGIDSIFRTAEVVGDAWSWLVMREALLYDVSRFDDFQSRLGIARSTLSGRLTQLTTGGLLGREPGQRYVATESGRDFFSCLMVAMRWGDRWYFPADAPPQRATHIACGRPVNAALRCEACHKVIDAHEVTARRAGTVARPRTKPGRAKRRSPNLELLERNRTCSIARTLTVTGDWWSGLLIRECFFGSRRFDDFQRRLDIAPNILSARLRRLVELDILAKVQYETWPTRYEYALTEKGLDYYHVPLAMLTWGRQWLAPNTDVRLTHVPCQSPLHPQLACAACSQTFSRDDIALAAT